MPCDLAREGFPILFDCKTVWGKIVQKQIVFGKLTKVQKIFVADAIKWK